MFKFKLSSARRTVDIANFSSSVSAYVSSQRPTIVVDVDGTVVDLLSPWFDWYRKLTKKEPVKNKEYSVHTKMPGVDPMIFLKENPSIYDRLEPYREAISVLRDLSDSYNIVFATNKISIIHAASKIAFLEKYFPFNRGIAFTNHKSMQDGFLLIDDAPEYRTEWEGDHRIAFDIGKNPENTWFRIHADILEVSKMIMEYWSYVDKEVIK